jgi:DNA-binding XRE family transcriptional regulator
LNRTSSFSASRPGSRLTENHYTAAEAKRLLAGESPLRIWREKRGLTQRALAAAAAIPAGYLNEIEKGKKPGSVAAYRTLATALAVPIEDLIGDE